MEQLPGIFFIACLAFIIPVAIAHFVVRADWRTILKTCLIWYGSLFLAFGAFSGGDRVGWTLLAAMFFSVPAVPIIAAVLRGWNWLGRSKVGVASTGLSRPLLQRFPWSLVTPEQLAAVALLAVAYFGYSRWSEQRDLHARAELAGRFLDLPAGTKFSAFQTSNSPATAPRIAAIVRFTKPQFEAFVAQLEQVPLWPQGPPQYDGAPVEVVSPQNIRWREVPLPVQAGNRFVSWNNLSAAELRSLRRGRVLCIALQRKPGSNRGTNSSGVPSYAANDCSELAKTERVSVIVLGALDFETQTLHMIIK